MSAAARDDAPRVPDPRSSLRALGLLASTVFLAGCLTACVESPTSPATPDSAASPAPAPPVAGGGDPDTPTPPADPNTGPPRSASPAPAEPKKSAEPKKKVVIASPLHIPLPTDRLQGKKLESGLADLQVRIAKACGGDQCVTVELLPDDSEVDESTCGTISEIVSAQFDAAGEAFIEVPRGGTITLYVRAACPETPSPSPATPPSPEPGVDSPAPDVSRSDDPPSEVPAPAPSADETPQPSDLSPAPPGS